AGKDGGGTPTVDAYCALIQANCTAANAQYASLDDCKKAAAALPIGTSTSETAGDDLGCRTYHSNAAKTDATTHCPHAGPFGGGGAGLVCGPAADAGANPQCEAFCKIALAACNGANVVFADAAACATACAAFANDAALPYGVADSADTKNNFN